MSRAHATFEIAVDLVVLTVRDGRLAVLLIERGNEPFRGRPALPGGFLRAGEDLLDAAARELAEETGLRGITPDLRQVATYAAPGRDPRGRVATVAYLAILPDLPVPTAGTDAAIARWAPVGPGPDGLAFDHDRILADAVEHARRLLEDTPLATAFCREPFTVAELRGVYEAVWGVALDPRNFHRKVTGVPGYVEPTGDLRSLPTGRPAALFRRGPAEALYPPLQRPRRSLPAPQGD
ncbi:NUDIX domain-containing protein [Actinoplanes sp. DH11]|uniref:NUDIX hydrolase n=1 Tax=Actinoplanes sp. DH11 TaxID=2857011 RepID=UPI001E452CBF|nr:NUDIX domain-containing protein [Actinoplanes sp. DH11]